MLLEFLMLELVMELDNEEIILVDVRSKDVIEAEGQIEGSVHVPRDMLEFHADQRPDNPLRKEELDPEKKIVKGKKTNFFPENWSKTYFQWMNNTTRMG